MALRTEEAQTTGRYCERFHFNVKVLVYRNRECHP